MQLSIILFNISHQKMTDVPAHYKSNKIIELHVFRLGLCYDKVCFLFFLVVTSDIFL